MNTRYILFPIIVIAFFGGGFVTKDYLSNEILANQTKIIRIPADAGVSRIVAPGKIEPDGEERQLSFDGSGILQKIHVKEGDQVKKGTVLAELLNEEQQSRLNVARRVLDKANSQWDLMKKGFRVEEIEEARAEGLAWQASADFYLKTLATREKLRQSSAVSLEDLEEIRFKGKEASQRREAALAKLRRLQIGQRPEEIAIAKMETAVAQARVAEAQAALDRTRIFAPIDGTVIRIMRNEGESVTGIESVPVILLANLSRLFVRAEIDESELEFLKPGIPIYIQEKRGGTAKISGKLVKVMGRMGRRHLQTDDPHDLVDRRVLEVLGILDGNPNLRLQQRVDVYIPTTPLEPASNPLPKPKLSKP